MRRLLLAVLFSFSAAFGANQTFHVRPDGHDTNCSGLFNASDASTATTDCAKLTIQAAVNAWTGTGNTVLLHAGTINAGASCSDTDFSGPAALYLSWNHGPSGHVDQSGAAGAYNVVKAANDGTVSVSANGCDHMIHIDASYIQIGGLGAGEGFTVQGDSTMIAWLTNGTRLSGAIHIHEPGVSDRIYGLNFLKYTGNMQVGEVGNAQIFIIGSGVTNHHIAGNTIRSGNIGGAIHPTLPSQAGSHDCDSPASIVNFLGNVTVENNIILHDVADVTVAGKRTQALGGEATKDVIYRNNYIRMGTSAAGGDSSQEWYGISIRQGCRTIIENNYIEFYSAQGASYPIFTFQPSTTSNQRHRIYNNTVYGRAPIGIYDTEAESTSVINNIVHGNVGSAIGTSIRGALNCGATGITYGYNDTFNAGAISPCASDTNLGGNITSNPSLSLSGNHPTPFFQLSAGSPAINAGCPAATCPNAPTTDYDGQIRSNPPDIGADEQSAAAADTTAPSAIGNGYCTGSGTPLACCTGSGTGSCQLAVSAPTKAPQLGATITWKSTGDDTTTGTATSYTLRGVGKVNDASAAPTVTGCSDGAALTAVLNASGTVVTTLPLPLPAGSTETWVVKGLRPNWRYAFAVCASDEASNQSGLSNVVNITTAKYQGYGYQTNGGGFTGSTPPTVTLVTNTNDSGAGSFRNAVAVGDNNVVMPTVGGTITLTTRVDLRGLDNWTFDASTAPSPGLTITTATDLDDSLRIGDATHLILTYFRIQGRWFWVPTNPGACTPKACSTSAECGVGTCTNNTCLTTCTSDADCGSGTFCANPREIADFISFNNATSGVVANVVLDHITIRDTGDSGWDLFDAVTDGTFSYLNIMRNHYGQTTGSQSLNGELGTKRITWHHNAWLQNGERLPQLTGSAADSLIDLDYRNNIIYEWGYDPNPAENYTVGTYGIRIRNGNGGVGADNAVNRLNIVNNWFAVGPTTTTIGPTDNQALVYGNANGGEAEDGGPGCGSQGTVELGTLMGAIWVSGNTFPAGTCDSYSTVASENALVTSGAQVTTDSTGAMCSTVLGVAGTQFPRSDETAVMSQAFASLSCGGAQTCGNNIREGTEQCDGTDLGGHTCAEFSCSVGTPTCSSCSIVQTGCSFCGPPRLKGGKITGGGGVR